ncbi:energy transducer TonB [Sphingobium amiense]|uniref:Energy transducer TonB n=1 Tax=Sphingobium amiense TaxID=135719 RepID=A0A494W6B2_9SPHN|nr:energy transducer TonB [Sphingobium amiense]BBD98728.1 energy transducer TonB [Sphingobium amiense]
MTPPAPTKVKSWIPKLQFPKETLEAGEEGVTIYRLLVSADGKPYDCTLLHSSGSAELDRQTCEGMSGASYKPATDEQGVVRYGVIIGAILWQGQFNWSLKWPPDLTLNVRSLPRGAKEKTVTVAVAIDAAGKVTGCSRTPADIGMGGLVDVACMQVRMQDATALKDEFGKPVKSVQTFRVSFVVEH